LVNETVTDSFILEEFPGDAAITQGQPPTGILLPNDPGGNERTPPIGIGLLRRVVAPVDLHADIVAGPIFDSSTHHSTSDPDKN
jgi:hypothetical protein